MRHSLVLKRAGIASVDTATALLILTMGPSGRQGGAWRPRRSLTQSYPRMPIAARKRGRRESGWENVTIATAPKSILSVRPLRRKGPPSVGSGQDRQGGPVGQSYPPGRCGGRAAGRGLSKLPSIGRGPRTRRPRTETLAAGADVRRVSGRDAGPGVSDYGVDRCDRLRDVLELRLELADSLFESGHVARCRHLPEAFGRVRLPRLENLHGVRVGVALGELGISAFHGVGVRGAELPALRRSPHDDAALNVA